MRIIDTSFLRAGDVLSADDQHWVYNGLDCCVTLEIVNVLLEQLDDTTRTTYEFSKQLQGPILDMSMRGFLIDERARKEILTETLSDIKYISNQIDEIISRGIGISINWRSPAQLKTLFYGVLGLPPIKKRNVHGIYAATVNRDALEHMQSYLLAEPICLRLLMLRDLDKRRQFLQTGIDPDKRIRCNFNIAGTNTGRLSSSLSDMGTGTNLQNVDRKLRFICVADPGKKLANLDLEQADARNVGAICWNNFVDLMGEADAGRYLDACESGDLHTAVCKLAWQNLAWTGDLKADKRYCDQLIAYRQDSYRMLAKRLGHGTNYYGTARTMAKHTRVPTTQIADFQERYFNGFPCITAWHEWVKEQLKYSGTITTLFGRRRMFHGRATDDTTIREAIAYAPQSMTGDEINTGIIRLFKANKVDLIVQVHDNVVFQFDENREDEIIPWAIEQLRVMLPLKRDRQAFVPVDAKTGWNWADQEYDKQGNVVANEDGLRKWNGNDNRKRTQKKQLSLEGLLN